MISSGIPHYWSWGPSQTAASDILYACSSSYSLLTNLQLLVGDGPLNFKTTLDVDSFLISDLSIAQTNWLAQSASAFCKQGAKKTEIRIAAD